MKNFQYYGGKGIRVCDEWQNYIAFALWARSNGYQEGLSIERKDSNGNYEPSNCEWISRAENTRRTSLTIPRDSKGRLMRRVTS